MENTSKWSPHVAFCGLHQFVVYDTSGSNVEQRRWRMNYYSLSAGDLQNKNRTMKALLSHVYVDDVMTWQNAHY